MLNPGDFAMSAAADQLSQRSAVQTPSQSEDGGQAEKKMSKAMKRKKERQEEKQKRRQNVAANPNNDSLERQQDRQ